MDSNSPLNLSKPPHAAQKSAVTIAPMKFHPKTLTRICTMLAPLVFTAAVNAGSGDASSPAPQTSTRYGLFGLLDHRSGYGESTYPEPFLVNSSNLELNEFRMDWFHSGIHSQRADEFTMELERGFGLLTVEVELHYFRESTPGVVEKGLGNVDLGARHPIFQYVSAQGVFDTTLGVALEVGIPTNTVMSKSTELVPKIFNDLRIGSHFTLQSVVGYSALYGGEEDGIHTFEYGFTFGYAIPHKDLPIPGVQQITPVFEIEGARQLNKAEDGRNSVLGNAAIRFNLKSLGSIQPRLGVGYVFPMNSTAREELHWGIYTSLVFEY